RGRVRLVRDRDRCRHRQGDAPGRGERHRGHGSRAGPADVRRARPHARAARARAPRVCAAVARPRGGPPVRVVTARLEELGDHPPVDLLYAAAAWHWTDPETRWELAARLLREGGVFACLGGPVDIADEDLAARVELLREEVIGSEDVPGATDD